MGEGDSFRKLTKRILTSNRFAYRFGKTAQMFSRHLTGAIHERDYSLFARLPADGHFADIGANWGQSALSFAAVNRRWKISSFEINSSLEPALRLVRLLLGKRFSYYLYGIGEASELNLYIPQARGIQYTGEATLHEDELKTERVRSAIGRPFDVVAQKVQLKPFEDFDLVPDIVKIDVQGHELAVLKSMQVTIRKHRPIFLIESGSQFARCEEFLASEGYDCYVSNLTNRRLVSAKLGGAPLNYFFVHSYSRPDVVAALIGG